MTSNRTQAYRSLRVGLAGIALLLGACDRAEPPKGAASGTAAQPSLVERAIGLTRDATQTLADRTSAAAAQASGAATEKARAFADSALIQGSGLAELSVAKAQALIDQAKAFIAKGRPELAAAAMEPLRQAKSALPPSLSAEVERLDARLKGLAQPPSAAAGGER